MHLRSISNYYYVAKQQCVACAVLVHIPLEVPANGQGNVHACVVKFLKIYLHYVNFYTCNSSWDKYGRVIGLYLIVAYTVLRSA
jgi:hypothetical protein